MRYRVQALCRGCAWPSQDSALVAATKESVMVQDDGMGAVRLMREGGRASGLAQEKGVTVEAALAELLYL